MKPSRKIQELCGEMLKNMGDMDIEDVYRMSIFKYLDEEYEKHQELVKKHNDFVGFLADRLGFKKLRVDGIFVKAKLDKFKIKEEK